MNAHEPLIVIEGWTWTGFDEPGCWDGVLGEPAPTHGWRRVVELEVLSVTYLVTEWHFGPKPPDSSSPVGWSVQVLRDRHAA